MRNFQFFLSLRVPFDGNKKADLVLDYQAIKKFIDRFGFMKTCLYSNYQVTAYVTMCYLLIFDVKHNISKAKNIPIVCFALYLTMDAPLVFNVLPKFESQTSLECCNDRDGIMSTPAVFAVIRKRKACVFILLFPLIYFRAILVI